MCPLIKWFYGQVKFGEWWVEYRERSFLTALLRAFGVCHNFPETGFSRQVSPHYLTREHILPPNTLLGLVFPGTHLEKICPTGNTGGLGSSHDFVPNSLCVPGPFIFLPSPCVLQEEQSPRGVRPSLSSTCFYLGDKDFHACIWILTFAFPSAPDLPLNQNPCLISFSSKPKSCLTNLFLSSRAMFFQARNFAVIPDFSYLLHPLYFFIPSAKHSSLMFFPTVFFLSFSRVSSGGLISSSASPSSLFHPCVNP